MNEKIRVAIRTKRIGVNRPTYGYPQPDGSLIEDNGTIHPDGTWFRSRQSTGEVPPTNDDENSDISV